MAGWATGGGGDVHRGGVSTTGQGAALGTTRNRSELFFKYRRQAHGLNGSHPAAPPRTSDPGLETARLMASALGAASSDLEAGLAGAGAGAAAPPRYVDFKEQLRADMGEIRERMAELRALHGRASLSKFEDSRGEEVAVEVLTQQVTRMFRRCEASLQQFGAGAAAGEADARVKRAVQRTLAVELQRLSVQFRKQQKQYLQRLRGRDGGGGGGGTLSLLDDGAGGGAAGGRDADDQFDPGFSDLQSQRVDTLSSLVTERDRETQKILTSIHELAQIMKDLSVLVIDQGTVLDRIDYNLEQTSAVVERGVAQLRRAERAQRRGFAAACVMILLVAVAVMLVLLLIKAVMSF